ncbi:MAG: ABC transporter substrate-binding protein [Alphaproteobacteria bacterium]|nr:ABC transporter substrate-binding protein [Alphaproteobacteria bacterium]
MTDQDLAYFDHLQLADTPQPAISHRSKIHPDRRRRPVVGRFTRPVLSAALIFGVLGFGVLGAPSEPTAAPVSAAEQEAAMVLVRSVIDDGNGAIAQARESQDGYAAFTPIYMDRFATDAIGRTLLGHYWPVATGAEQAQLIAAFGEYLADRLVARFPSGTFTLFEAEAADRSQSVDDGLLIVHTVFATLNSSNRIDWRLTLADGELKIIDIIFSGKSLMEDKHREFAAFLGNNDGSVGALIASLVD